MNGYSERLSEALGQIFGSLAILWLLGLAILIGVVALITWVVKKIWNAGNESKKSKSQNDWLREAQKRQNSRYDYTDPVQRPRRQKGKQKPQNEPTWYPSGWTWNEEKQLWDPPDFLEKESAERWEWNENAGIWVDKWQMNKEQSDKKQKEVRKKWEEYQKSTNPKPKVTLSPDEKELAKKINIDHREPTFEEWKTTKQTEQKTETTYRYKKEDIEQDK